MKACFVAAALLSGVALAEQPTFTTPNGIVVKQDMPGAFRGNPNSDKPGNPKKTYICHATSAVDNNGFLVLHVGNPAAAAHLAHEHATAEEHGQGKAKRDGVGRIITTDCVDERPT